MTRVLEQFPQFQVSKILDASQINFIKNNFMEQRAISQGRSGSARRALLECKRSLGRDKPKGAGIQA
jgi:hypothetical protein